MSVRSSWFMILFKISISLFFFHLVISLKVGYWNIQLLLLNCPFLPSILSFLLHIFWGFLVGYILVYNCYIFLIKLPFDHYVMFFVHPNNFCHKVHLADIKIATSALFWLLLAWSISFHTLLSTCLCFWLLSESFIDSIQLTHEQCYWIPTMCKELHGW